MKFKLKEINCENFNNTKVELNNGTIYNIKYNNDSFEFQTPKMIIDSLVKEYDHEYIILKILPTQACKIFCLKIKQIEQHFSDLLKSPLKSVFENEFLTVKIPFKYSKPLVKVYKDDSLYNYYHLTKDLEILCLLSIEKIWINNFDEASYHLNVKEIMIC